jgi:Spermine/spermidine synthase domain
MRNDRFQLIAASFLMLFTELVLIRWAGAYVVFLSYFSNFVLLGSFLGVGLGFLRAHKGPDLFRWAPVALAAFLALVQGFPVQIDRSGGDLIYFSSLETKGLPIWVMLPFVFLAVAAIMTMIAYGVAQRFRKFPALEAYRLDIIGSLSGIVAFSLLAYFRVPPVGWMTVIAVLIVSLTWRPSALTAIAAIAIIGVALLGTGAGETFWSQYYRVQFFAQDKAISVNGIPHQAMVDITQPNTPYPVPYQRLEQPPKDVLVIGAGNGNDVAAALAAGAEHVDAVEIDPQLQDLGAQYHPDQPYEDPRVTRITNDGRAYLEQTDKTYDLIIFALPDSLTLVSGQSAVRLESFLFTEQAIGSARDHLNPGGAFSMYNYYRESWLVDRLAGTLLDVFGHPPCLDKPGLTGGNDVGSFTTLTIGLDPSAATCQTTWSATGEIVRPATDDRPFVYLKTPSIPSRYLWTLGMILLVSAIGVRLAGGRFGAMAGYLDLFFMGAGFLLLETKSVVQFALLFGTTWFVNAIVFAGILLTVLIAIEVEQRTGVRKLTVLYPLLFVGLLIAGLVPGSWLLSLDTIPRFVAATLLAFFPVFIANLVFASRFRDTADPTTAFGANLLGAMVGGVLEYLSLITGYRGLLVLAALLYALAWVFGARKLGGETAGEAPPEPAATPEPAPTT